MIEKGLALVLLRVVQSEETIEKFGASAKLRAFMVETGIGLVQGRSVFFSASHKQRIRAWLAAENIDPNTSPDAWRTLGRAEALAIGPDEKWAGKAVRAHLISIKALNGLPLLVDDQAVYLPPLANLEWSCQRALESLRHDAVVVVENWETFERIDDFQVNMNHVSSNPLILWRGGASGTSVGAAMRFLESYRRPVWSAPDYDPEGLAIASRLPHLAGVLAPQDDVLQKLLDKSRLHQRFSAQLPGAKATLDQATNPDVKHLWAIVSASANALPQERLCLKR
ncbi:hypothetical protein K8353_38840 [Burkholderia contaminans]|nr:hypothetical protein [Burkholderia contaminans]